MGAVIVLSPIICQPVFVGVINFVQAFYTNSIQYEYFSIQCNPTRHQRRTSRHNINTNNFLGSQESFEKLSKWN